MFRVKGLIMATVLVCFALMAVNSNPVMADDAVELDILNRVKQIRRILNKKVLPAVTEAEVLRTGQTTSYATGDDGDLQKGKPWPNPRFTDNGNGTVTDNMTGLIWLKDANCFGQKTWAQALSDCNTLASGSCGLTDGSSAGDWRLANIRELHSLIDYGNFAPALPLGHPFLNVVYSIYPYWSSTTVADLTSAVWFVSLGTGWTDVSDKNADNLHVWPVRDPK